MKAHYAGSIAYDNERDEWEDELVMAFTFKDLCNDLRSLMECRKNSEVFFASYINKDGIEHDVTQKVREEIG